MEETPDEGSVTITVELPALCSSKYCSTDVSTSDSLVLTQLLTSIVNKSKIIDRKKLCILEEKVIFKSLITSYCM